MKEDFPNDMEVSQENEFLETDEKQFAGYHDTNLDNQNGTTSEKTEGKNKQLDTENLSEHMSLSENDLGCGNNSDEIVYPKLIDEVNSNDSSFIRDLKIIEDALKSNENQKEGKILIKTTKNSNVIIPANQEEVDAFNEETQSNNFNANQEKDMNMGMRRKKEKKRRIKRAFKRISGIGRKKYKKTSKRD